MTGSARRAITGVAVVLLAVGFLAFTAPASRATGSGGGYTWIQQGPAPGGHAITGMSALDASRVWSVGNAGSVFFWNGSTLTESWSGTDNDLYDVSALSEGTGSRVWAVGEGAVIRYYNGTSWVGQASPNLGYSYDLWSVAAVRTGTNTYRAWAVGATDGFHNAIILYYNGTSWALDENYATGQFNAVEAVRIGTTNYVWAAGSDYELVSGNHGRVMFSNGTGTWTSRNTDYALMSVDAVDQNNMFGVEWDGTVLSSTDGGFNWSPMFTDWWPASVNASATNNLWVVGWEGNARYYNGSWGTTTTVTDKDLFDASVLGAASVFAGGDQRFLTYSGTWSTEVGGSTQTLYGIDGYSASSVWVGGDNDPTFGNVSYTTNGGASWASRPTPNLPSIRGVSAINASNVWVCGVRYIYRWNGSSWVQQLSANLTVRGISMASTTRGWAVTDNQRIRYYNGSNWNSMYNPNNDLYAVTAASTTRVWAVGAGGGIWRTTTGGTAFSQQSSPTTSDLYGVHAPNTTTVWAVGAGGTIIYTTDAGVNWASQDSGVTDNLRGVYAFDANTAWAVGDNGTIVYTSDAGQTWTEQENPLTYNLNAVWVYDANNIWAVGEGGTILFADPPYVKDVAPRYAAPGATVEAVVYGGYTHFDEFASVIDMGEGVTAVPVHNLDNSNTWLAAQVTVDPDAEPGPRDVTVTTGDEVAVPLEGGFVVGDQPSIAGASPGAGARGQTLDVEITGSASGFNETSQAQLGMGVSVNSVTCTAPDRVTANVTIDPDASAGARDVNVVTGTEVPLALPGGFNVLEPPTVTGLSPGTGKPGTMVTIEGSGFGAERSYLGGHAVSTVDFNGTPAGAYTEWTDTRIVCEVPASVETGPVVVNTPGGASDPDRVFTAASGSWYLAEGTTAWGFETEIAIVNPNADEVAVRVTYFTPDGPVGRPDITMPPNSRVTINPASEDNLAATDFSTRVECLGGEDIAADRTMYWRGEGAAGSEGHASIGATAPSTTWYLAEGSSAWGFETWLTVQNPGAGDATCQVTYMTEGWGQQTVTKTVPAGSRRSFNIADDIGAKDSSIRVVADVPVVAERSMYRNNRREGHNSIGVNELSRNYYLAEGTTAWGFTTYLTLQNPNKDAAQVTLTYMTPDGQSKQPTLTVPGNSRRTVKVNDALPGTDLSTRVESDLPLAAERAMYWDPGTGEACHDSVGASSPAMQWWLPGGHSGHGPGERTFETWTCVQNPNEVPVQVRVTYLTPGGTGNKSFTDTIPAGRRMTYDMARLITNGSAGIKVESLTPGGGVVVERSMYWDNRSAGTDTIGGRSLSF